MQKIGLKRIGLKRMKDSDTTNLKQHKHTSFFALARYSRYQKNYNSPKSDLILTIFLAKNIENRFKTYNYYCEKPFGTKIVFI